MLKTYSKYDSNSNFWENFSNEKLLDLKMCNLDLSLSTTFLEPLINKVKIELRERRICLDLNFWFSDEWFCADGHTGIALPFYLAHPRLIELERSQIGYAEGETEEWFLKLLRHEIGHVLDNAYKLRRMRKRHTIFGKASKSYPSYYTYRPYSKNYVRHLEDGYAQSHPAEDFAETFAVWLDQASDWKIKYSKWPALKKLCYVDEVMQKIADQRPSLTNNLEVDPISSISKTLRQHYRQKRTKFGIDEDHFWDSGLLSIFSNAPKHINKPAASSFLTNNRSDICRHVSLETGYPKYNVNQMLDSVIDRSNQLNLKIVQKEIATERNLRYYLSRRAKDYMSEGRHLIAL